MSTTGSRAGPGTSASRSDPLPFPDLLLAGEQEVDLQADLLVRGAVRVLRVRVVPDQEIDLHRLPRRSEPVHRTTARLPPRRPDRAPVSSAELGAAADRCAPRLRQAALAERRHRPLRPVRRRVEGTNQLAQGAVIARGGSAAQRTSPRGVVHMAGGVEKSAPVFRVLVATGTARPLVQRADEDRALGELSHRGADLCCRELFDVDAIAAEGRGVRPRGARTSGSPARRDPGRGCAGSRT